MTDWVEVVLSVVTAIIVAVGGELSCTVGVVSPLVRLLVLLVGTVVRECSVGGEVTRVLLVAIRAVAGVAVSEEMMLSNTSSGLAVLEKGREIKVH